jgi:hypothetical protein
MPANIIFVNLEPKCNVPDSKMEELLQWLERNGHPLEEDAKAKLRGKYSPEVSYND